MFFLAINGGSLLKRFKKINHEGGLELQYTRDVKCQKANEKIGNGDSDTVKDEPCKNQEGTHNRCSSKCGTVVSRM
jgi:hypothetical protein